jgi:bacteriorhodopsin
MQPMTKEMFDLVYNSLSFTLASMMASTIFFWLRVGSIDEKYKSAMTITGLVTFIAAYHYIRIFNSWVDAYEFPPGNADIGDPTVTGIPFNDAYRYMDWLLTVPLLLIEIIFCMKIEPAEMTKKAWLLGVSSGLMIALGYPGELIIGGPMLYMRFIFWFLAMLPFGYVVYTLLIGVKEAIAAEENPAVAAMLTQVCWATVISWCTYPVVYLFPFFGFKGMYAVVGIQLGYCTSDIISKCGVGFLIYNITITKSAAMAAEVDDAPPAKRGSVLGSIKLPKF